ncbi:single-stranded DNA-binding protein [Streptomyces sp. KLOTTS4A1]|uniref:single-stranded DNA-binding protein n=1 Tax=Streptomyces sp. KLOTTS4A1 TaxID=3390996 RepID=UPI0039F53214
MNETLVTVVGNVATEPVARAASNGTPMLRFRLASSSRYYDRTAQGWKDGHTNFLTVFAWRALAENAASSLNIGDPVVVQGRLKVRQESPGSGQQGVVGVDIEAVALGHDLSRGTAAFRRASRANPGLTGGGGEGSGSGDDPGVRSGLLPERAPEPVF